MRIKYVRSFLFSFATFLSSPAYASEAVYRIVTMVSDTGGCSYSVEEENWTASLKTVLRDWIGEWVHGVDIKDTGDVFISSVDKFRVVFDQKYELYSEDGHGKKVLYKVVTLSGIAVSAPESIFVKVNKSDIGGGNINQPVRLIKCKSAEDDSLSPEERIRILQEHESQRLRGLENRLGDTLDDVAVGGITTVLGRATPLGGAADAAIGAAFDKATQERNSNVNNRADTYLEEANKRSILATEMCNTFIGADSCR
ncbi:hypothetical protein G6M64_01180 [Agrobacterium tumefaciens]|uniref:hypothetical protein n=2 Tax=Agrobacterium tumefaciens TaxID=358 RepID=UPI001573C792|nr:hypothetical protein [Agrobacterium tumefaciens]NTB25602.1 hypothetical protein [Agrobacterium tumefaciens]NTB48902.1 hypothetical protein [Agrobacterium tumefaciens]NTB83210.1 hypothetical protein [Agrobacterium tumefaciens]NTC05393.1 hypothetical protein [Agrobacterium tumefaciens]NTC36022.1 hypothetical protein [Agrobacterium tumefaciens]